LIYIYMGCVIAPALFNIFLDAALKTAFREFPEGSGFQFNRRGLGPLPDGINRAQDLRIFSLMYADDIVLFAHSADVLRTMLRVLDKVFDRFGLAVNATKTMIQSSRYDSQDAQSVQLKGGVAGLTDDFKYLGSIIAATPSLRQEVRVRRGRAWGAFQQFKQIWSNKNLRTKDKMRAYEVFVRPHLLFGVETWNATAGDLQSLEVTHSDCLRTIMGVRRIDKIPLHHIYRICNSEPLQLTITKHTLRWLGHVARQGDERYPAQTFFCSPLHGAEKAPRGRPAGSYGHSYTVMLEALGGGVLGGEKPINWLSKVFRDNDSGMLNRAAWKTLVSNLSLKSVEEARPIADRIHPMRTRSSGHIDGHG
jgi:hypothetical protein